MIHIYKDEPNKTLYIPAHLNQIHQAFRNAEKPAPDIFEQARLLTPELTDEIIRAVNDSDEEYIIIDLRNITFAKKVFENFQSVEAGKKAKLIFINIDENSNIARVLLRATGARATDSVAADPKRLNDFKKQGGNDISQYSIRLVKNLILARIGTPAHGKVYLESSNVYSNIYVNSKSFFNEPRLCALIVYELCRRIKEEKIEYDLLLSASNSGAIIASSIGIILGRDTLFLNHLGPNMSISDEKMLNRICPGKRYWFIYDFICLGSEYKHADILVHSKGAKIVKAAGISKYKKVFRSPGDERDNDILSIIDINDENLITITVD
jgi:orotate phosphoribosyltransferase